MDNILFIPELNPVSFYRTTRQNIPAYFTKYIGDFFFEERLYAWQDPKSFAQIWQTTDIINLQFISSFDPIIIKLVNNNGHPVITLPALIGLPDKFMPGMFAFEVNMSLANLPAGCYFLQAELGAAGPQQEVLISPQMLIVDDVIDNSILLEYYNSTFHNDIIFETGIKFQYRCFGHFGFLNKARKDDVYRDEKYTSTLLNSKAAKQWPLYFGDEYGLPDEAINLIDEIWSCDHVNVDGKLFSISGDSEPEYITVDDSNEYPKRGLKLTVEEGINRNSRIFSMAKDVTKKFAATVIVDAAVFGDTSNQGSANTVPVLNVEIE